MFPVSPEAACAPTGCTLGGDIVINNGPPAPGAVVLADVTASGFSPNVGPFTLNTEMAALSDGLTLLEIENPAIDVLGLLLLEFPTPTVDSSVGYTGGPISMGTSVFGPREPIAATWEVTAGSLSERVPEPSSLLVLIAGLAATCGILGKRVLSKANEYSQLSLALAGPESLLHGSAGGRFHPRSLLRDDPVDRAPRGLVAVGGGFSGAWRIRGAGSRRAGMSRSAGSSGPGPSAFARGRIPDRAARTRRRPWRAYSREVRGPP
jgi:hypothetical protein